MDVESLMEKVLVQSLFDCQLSHMIFVNHQNLSIVNVYIIKKTVSLDTSSFPLET